MPFSALNRNGEIIDSPLLNINREFVVVERNNTPNQYPGLEHYMYAQRIVNDTDVNQEAILRREFLSRCYENPDTPVDQVFNEFAQEKRNEFSPLDWENEDLQDAITQQFKALVETDPNNKEFWLDQVDAIYFENPNSTLGMGSQRNGDNFVGKHFMQVCAEMRPMRQFVSTSDGPPIIDVNAAIREVEPMYQVAAMVNTNAVGMEVSQIPQADNGNNTGRGFKRREPAAAVGAVATTHRNVMDGNLAGIMVARKLLELPPNTDVNTKFKIESQNNVVTKVIKNDTFPVDGTPQAQAAHIRDLDNMLLAYVAGRDKRDDGKPIAISGDDPNSRAILIKLCEEHGFEYSCKDKPVLDTVVSGMAAARAMQSNEEYSELITKGRELRPDPQAYVGLRPLSPEPVVMTYNIVPSLEGGEQTYVELTAAREGAVDHQYSNAGLVPSNSNDNAVHGAPDEVRPTTEQAIRAKAQELRASRGSAANTEAEKDTQSQNSQYTAPPSRS